MTAEHLRVAIADDDNRERAEVKEMLESLGHDVVAEAHNGKQLIDAVAEKKPDLVVTDLNMPVMDGLEAADTLAKNDPVPVVVMTPSHAPDNVNRALRQHNIFGYLVKPFFSSALDGVVRLAYGLFGRFRGLEGQLAGAQQMLADRKLIERAKGILMKHFNIEEAEAHRRLQKMANSKNQKLVDLANTIIATGGAGL